MNVRNKLPSFDVAFGGLAELSRQDDTTKSRLYHQGTSVQTLNPPRSVYFSQTNSDQNNAHPINPLNKFRIAALTQDAHDSFEELDLTIIPESMPDENTPQNSDNETVDDTLFPTLYSYLFNQSCFSGNVPDIREPTPANDLNLDHHVTNLTADLANPQNSRSAAVIYPLNLQQATSDNPANSAEIVDNKSSQVERKRKYDRDRKRERYRNDPAYAERVRERQRERLKNPAYAERKKERYRNDPAFAERERERQREYQRERRKDPAYAEHKRQSYRERRKNPACVERKRERARKLEREHRKNPAYVERERERVRKLKGERYRNDPVYAERERERIRKLKGERYRNDPVYAVGQRIYVGTYNRVKKISGKEEASRLASAARAEYLQSVNSSGDSGDLPQTSNPEMPMTS